MTDLISRQVAIDAMAELQGMASTKAELKGISKAWKRIKQLPSTQPDIIQCEDCRYADEDGVCQNSKGLAIQDDYCYCSYAERRADA